VINMPVDIESESPSRSAATNWRLAMGVVLITLCILLPVFLRLSAPEEASSPAVMQLMLYGPALLAVLGCYCFDRKLEGKERRDALLLCLVCTLLTNYLHLWLVDNASSSWGANLTVQRQMHESAVLLKPEALPHSYRFLPDALIRLFEQITGNYEVARDSYRNLFGVLLFYTLYRFARRYLLQGGALFCLALWSAVLPVSYRYYAGQPADPMSHLSFLLAFIFIDTGLFIWLLLTLLIGALAKETVLAMAGYYVLVRWREPRYVIKAGALMVSGAIIYFGVRAIVLASAPGYEQISGVSMDHIRTNWENFARWHGPLLYIVGIFVPFVVFGWRTAPFFLRSLALYLFPVLFISGLVFSWLREGRNFMPLCAPLIIMTVHYLAPDQRRRAPAA
jgi:hypothetical protein